MFSAGENFTEPAIFVQLTVSVVALPAWGAEAPAMPPLTATMLTGIAIAAATTSILRIMYCSLFFHVSMDAKSGDVCPPT